MRQAADDAGDGGPTCTNVINTARMNTLVFPCAAKRVIWAANATRRGLESWMSRVSAEPPRRVDPEEELMRTMAGQDAHVRIRSGWLIPQMGAVS